MAKPGKSPSKSRGGGSSSDDEKKSPKRSVAPKKPSSSGSLTPRLKYRIRYEHGSRELVVGVIEAKVKLQSVPKLYILFDI